jgi:hypothetical protein
VLAGKEVKSSRDVDITKLPSILRPYKSKPYWAAVFPDLWLREKWPKSSLRAYVDDATLQRAVVSEPWSYLVKPFDERTLQTSIERALHQSDQ